ncbi:MAG: hypothetical protein Q9201_000790 [Fulgogasparrea decipioides]
MRKGPGQGKTFGEYTCYYIRSVAAWTVWKLVLERNKEEVTGPPNEYDENHTRDAKDPSRLRYIGHDFIGNEITDPVMRYIFE